MRPSERFRAADIAGIRALVVHAQDEGPKRFTNTSIFFPPQRSTSTCSSSLKDLRNTAPWDFGRRTQVVLPSLRTRLTSCAAIPRLPLPPSYSPTAPFLPLHSGVFRSCDGVYVNGCAHAFHAMNRLSPVEPHASRMGSAVAIDGLAALPYPSQDGSPSWQAGHYPAAVHAVFSPDPRGANSGTISMPVTMHRAQNRGCSFSAEAPHAWHADRNRLLTAQRCHRPQARQALLSRICCSSPNTSCLPERRDPAVEQDDSTVVVPFSLLTFLRARAMPLFG